MSDIVKRLEDMFFRFGMESPEDAAKRRIQTAKDAADEIERLRAESQKLAAFSHAYLSDYQEARGEIEKLRKVIREALKLADLDAIKSFRKTLLLALGEKE